MNTVHDELEKLPTDPDALRALVLSMKSERDALVAELMSCCRRSNGSSI